MSKGSNSLMAARGFVSFIQGGVGDLKILLSKGAVAATAPSNPPENDR